MDGWKDMGCTECGSPAIFEERQCQICFIKTSAYKMCTAQQKASTIETRWKKYKTAKGHLWWWNDKSHDWFFEATGSREPPVRKFGGSCSKDGDCCKSGNADSEGEESTASPGGDSTSVGDFTSSSIGIDMTDMIATVTGPRLLPIDKNDCTHRTFYHNMYDPAAGNHEAPHGHFVMER
jgi:hypothetical protein